MNVWKSVKDGIVLVILSLFCFIMCYKYLPDDNYSKILNSYKIDTDSNLTNVLIFNSDYKIVNTDSIVNRISYDDFVLIQYDSVESAKKAYEIAKDNGVCEQDVLLGVSDGREFGVSGEVDCVVDDTFKELISKKRVIDVKMYDVALPKSSTKFSDLDVIRQYLEDNIQIRDVIVAVIDTGYSGSNDNVLDTVNFSTEISEDLNGHGTRMTNIILSNSYENIKVLPLKVADKNGRATLLQVYKAIKYAIEKKVDVINISMNAKVSSGSGIIKEAIDEATEKGIKVIVSAGNAGEDVSDYIPSSIDSAIVISALTENFDLQEFSNYGGTVDYGVVAGSTSDASAYATNVIARLLGCGSDLSVLDNMKEGAFNCIAESDICYPTDSNYQTYNGDGFNVSCPLVEADVDSYNVMLSRVSDDTKILVNFKAARHCYADDSSYGRCSLYKTKHGEYIGTFPSTPYINSTTSFSDFGNLDITNYFSGNSPYYDKTYYYSIGGALDYDGTYIVPPDEWNSRLGDYTLEVLFCSSSMTVWNYTEYYNSDGSWSGVENNWHDWTVYDEITHYRYWFDSNSSSTATSAVSWNALNYVTSSEFVDVFDDYSPSNEYDGKYCHIEVKTKTGRTAHRVEYINFPKYTINYYIDGSCKYTDTQYLQKKLTLRSGDTKTGYIFQGWYTGKNGTGDKVTAVPIYNMEKTLNLYAYYTEAKYKISVDGNGGTSSWTGDRDLYNNEKCFYLQNGIAYYYKASDGSERSWDWSNNSDNDYMPFTATRTGYTFNGFYTSKTDGTLILKDKEMKVSNTYFAADSTIYAQWTPNTTSVTLDANGGYYYSLGGSTTNTFTATYDIASYGLREISVRQGYDFGGYFDSSGNEGYYMSYSDTHKRNLAYAKCGGTYWNSDGAWKSTASSVTLYAKWTPRNDTKYTVEHYYMTLDGDYTSEDSDLYIKEELQGTTDTTVTPAVKPKTGFTSPSTQQVTIYGDGSGLVKYYYTRNKYKVTYDYKTNGGTSNGTESGDAESVEVYFEGDVNVSTSDHKAFKSTGKSAGDYTHLGWNTDNTSHEKLSSLKMGTSDITLYAIYYLDVKATYHDTELSNADSTSTGRLWNNDTSVSVTVPSLDTKTFRATLDTSVQGTVDPTYVDYTWTFKGWKTDSSNALTKDLSATTTEVSISDLVTFNSKWEYTGDGLPEASRYHSKFLGWYSRYQYSSDIETNPATYWGTTGTKITIKKDTTLYSWFNYIPTINSLSLGNTYLKTALKHTYTDSTIFHIGQPVATSDMIANLVISRDWEVHTLDTFGYFSSDSDDNVKKWLYTNPKSKTYETKSDDLTISIKSIVFENGDTQSDLTKLDTSSKRKGKVTVTYTITDGGIENGGVVISGSPVTVDLSVTYTITDNGVPLLYIRDINSYVNDSTLNIKDYVYKHGCYSIYDFEDTANNNEPWWSTSTTSPDIYASRTDKILNITFKKDWATLNLEKIASVKKDVTTLSKLEDLRKNEPTVFNNITSVKVVFDTTDQWGIKSSDLYKEADRTLLITFVDSDYGVILSGKSKSSTMRYISPQWTDTLSGTYWGDTSTSGGRSKLDSILSNKNKVLNKSYVLKSANIANIVVNDYKIK